MWAPWMNIIIITNIVIHRSWKQIGTCRYRKIGKCKMGYECNEDEVIRPFVGSHEKDKYMWSTCFFQLKQI